MLIFLRFFLIHDASIEVSLSLRAHYSFPVCIEEENRFLYHFFFISKILPDTILFFLCDLRFGFVFSLSEFLLFLYAYFLFGNNMDQLRCTAFFPN